MHQRIFKLVENALECLARVTGVSYNEINIITFYFLIPFSWLLMLDIYFEFHYLKIGFVLFSFGFYVGCRNFKNYADWLFKKSVSFLNYFNRFGCNYVASSVWFCVVVLILIYLLLFFLISAH